MASKASGFQACTEGKLVKGISEWTEGHRMRHSADPFQFKAQSCPSGDQLQRLYVIKETAIPGFHSWLECHKTHVDSQLSEKGSENFQTLTHDTDLTIYMD